MLSEIGLLGQEGKKSLVIVRYMLEETLPFLKVKLKEDIIKEQDRLLIPLPAVEDGLNQLQHERSEPYLTCRCCRYEIPPVLAEQELIPMRSCGRQFIPPVPFMVLLYERDRILLVSHPFQDGLYIKLTGSGLPDIFLYSSGKYSLKASMFCLLFSWIFMPISASFRS